MSSFDLTGCPVIPGCPWWPWSPGPPCQEEKNAMSVKIGCCKQFTHPFSDGSSYSWVSFFPWVSLRMWAYSTSQGTVSFPCQVSQVSFPGDLEMRLDTHPRGIPTTDHKLHSKMVWDWDCYSVLEVKLDFCLSISSARNFWKQLYERGCSGHSQILSCSHGEKNQWSGVGMRLGE